MTERRADMFYQRFSAAVNPIILVTCGYLATTSYQRINTTLERIETRQSEYVEQLGAIRERVTALETEVENWKSWPEENKVIHRKKAP